MTNPATADSRLQHLWNTIVERDASLNDHDVGQTLIIREPVTTFERQQNLGALPRLDPHQEFSEFQLSRTLGQGGMGLIRLARQVSLWRDVAIKTILPERLDEASTYDLLRESWITGKLEHPNIVPVHALGVDENGAPMLVMKHVEGISWEEALLDPSQIPDALRAGRDLIETHLFILLQVCNAVEFAHSNAIIHCDLKPANIMLGAYGEVYLLDWGIAVSLENDGSGRLPLATDISEPTGTPCYMAPELAHGLGDKIGPWTDVYLLGAILHEVLTGAPKHSGSTVLSVLIQAVASRPVDYPDSVPIELAQICNRATHVDQNARFASVAALRQELTSFLKHRDSQLLATEAQERLHLLRNNTRKMLAAPTRPSDESVADLHRLFTECRFGFEQALSIWPENLDAQRGRQQSLQLMIEFAFSQRDATTVARHINALQGPDPGYAERLDELRADLQREAHEIEENKEIRHAFDLDLASRARSFMCLLLGLLFGIVPILNHVAISAGLLRLDFPSYFLQFALIITSAGLVVFLLRRRLLENRINARIVACVFVILFGGLLTRIIGFTLGLDPAGCIALENILYGFAITMMATSIDRTIWPASIPFFACAFIGALDPDHILLYDGITNAIALGTLAFLWRERRR